MTMGYSYQNKRVNVLHCIALWVNLIRIKELCFLLCTHYLSVCIQYRKPRSCQWIKLFSKLKCIALWVNLTRIKEIILHGLVDGLN